MNTAILFEEVKAMFRTLTDQVSDIHSRLPELERGFEEEEPPLPPWAAHADELLDELQSTSDQLRRLGLWESVAALASARSANTPRGLDLLTDALRNNDVIGLRSGVAQLRAHLDAEGRIAARDEDDFHAYDILNELAELAEAWLPGGSGSSIPSA
jgi:hypothetical protein